MQALILRIEFVNSDSENLPFALVSNVTLIRKWDVRRIEEVCMLLRSEGFERLSMKSTAVIKMFVYMMK